MRHPQDPTAHLLIQPKKFVVCRKGHVVEAPAHPTAQWSDDGMNVETVVICGRCHFELITETSGGVLMPVSTTREQAQAAARELHKQFLREMGFPCCNLKPLHEGECENQTDDGEKPV